MSKAPSPTPLDADGALWRFALRFYGEPGVAEACLTLQGRLGLDVNLMLLALFACLERRVVLDPDALAAADATTGPWHREIVQALRQVRTRLKEGPTPSPAPAPSAHTEQLRQDVKAAELRAEQLQLAALAAWLDEQAFTPAPSPDPEPVVADVARHFAGETWNRAADPESAAALAALVRAAQRRLGDAPA